MTHIQPARATEKYQPGEQLRPDGFCIDVALSQPSCTRALFDLISQAARDRAKVNSCVFLTFAALASRHAPPVMRQLLKPFA